jgi:hypothetical protein
MERPNVKCPVCGSAITRFRIYEDGSPGVATCGCGAEVPVLREQVRLLRGPDIVWNGERWETVTDSEDRS